MAGSLEFLGSTGRITAAGIADTTGRRGSPIQGGLPDRRVADHLQRAGHAAIDGAGFVPAGDIGGLGRLRPEVNTGA